MYKFMLIKKKDFIHWLLWFFLVILWNFGYPAASPIYDVLVAVILSIIFILLKKAGK
tara:strand:+ start:290 stop:460 length:171 start_codon:yes stop_codon:yes gene_type:complete